jgi:large subunit ribosomal protein L5
MADSKYIPTIKAELNSKIYADLKKELNLSNIHEVPRIEKVVVNVGLGKAKGDKKLFETATNTLKKITGRTPIQTTSKQSIAAFKLREGEKIGMKVTLRGDSMYEFLDRLINIVLPRLRDFHGVPSTAFDNQGNYSIGLTDQSVFPELTFEETNPAHGIQVVIVVKAKSKDHSKALLEKLGMPFSKESK